MALDSQHSEEERRWCCLSLSPPESRAEAHCLTVYLGVHSQGAGVRDKGSEVNDEGLI